MVKASVLLPVYNTNSDHLRAAIDSVLAQTFSDFELLIYNDASSLASVDQTVRSYKDERIRYICGQDNLGIARVRNLLIDLAQGEYLVVMDHDDICLPDRIRKQIDYMDQNPRVGVCGTAHRRFGNFFKNKTIRYPQSDSDIRASLFFKNVLHHPSAVMRKSVLIDNGIKYDADFVSANDRLLFVEISRHAELANLPDVLCLYRLHPGMTSLTKREAIKVEQKRLRKIFLDNMGARLTVQQEEVLNLYIMNGRHRARTHQTLLEMLGVINLLLEANERSGYLPHSEFRRECVRYLVKRCHAAAIFHGVQSSDILHAANVQSTGVRIPFTLKVINFVRGAQ